ncbi:hypothetical protein Tco_1531150 [Tanacetum coccineum]
MKKSRSYCSDILYAISIKKIRRICACASQETTKTLRPIRRIQFSEQVGLVGDLRSTSDVLILWVKIGISGLLVYEKPLSNTLVKSPIAMSRDYLQPGLAEQILEEYITFTKKNHISKDDGGKIIEKSSFEIKGMFLEKLARDTFSGTKGENVVEHIEKFLKIIRPINIQNISNSRLWINVFPISLTGAASEWFKEERMGSVATWVDLTKKFFDKFYTPSRTRRMENANEVTRLLSTYEPCVDKEGGSDEENEIAEIFRIETNLFNYETPLCIAFKEFNHLLQIDPNVLTDDVFGEKYYKEYKNDWIYEWNDKIPWRDDGYCNGGNLPGQYQVGNQIHYQDHEWYEALEDSDMKREALRNKAELEKSMNQEEESNGDAWSSYSPIDEWSDREEVNNKEPDVNYDPYLDIA